jgi:SAM-dependent methyltransferase
MKYRESNMPHEEMWDTFFHPDSLLDSMEVDGSVRTFVDVGCGYGTFLLPAAKRIQGYAVGIEIDDFYGSMCRKKSADSQMDQVHIIQQDLALMDISAFRKNYKDEIDYVALFNILHCEDPVQVLQRAAKMINDNGRIGVIHWKNEETPRGPSLDIRPTPDMIVRWASESRLIPVKQVDLAPYHYGLILNKEI